MQKNYRRISAVDVETGENLGNVLLASNEELVMKAVKEKTEVTEKQKVFLNNEDDFKKKCKNLGGYVHMIYTKNEILFNKTIDKANITRLIYLATFMDYTQKGLLIYSDRDKHGKFTNKKVMNKNKMKSILGLTDSTFKRFFKDVKENSMIFEVEGRYYLNTDYFIKGAVENFDSVNKSYCRLYINTVRSLYEGCTKVIQHRTLAHVLQLIPYIHYEHNILCKNPNEPTDIPDYLTLKDICELLGTSTTSSDMSKLAKQLYSFKLSIEGEDYHLFSYVIVNAIVDYFVVNPLVVYSGNNLKNMLKTSKAMFFNERTIRRKRNTN